MKILAALLLRPSFARAPSLSGWRPVGPQPYLVQKAFCTFLGSPSTTHRRGFFGSKSRPAGFFRVREDCSSCPNRFSKGSLLWEAASWFRFRFPFLMVAALTIRLVPGSSVAGGTVGGADIAIGGSFPMDGHALPSSWDRISRSPSFAGFNPLLDFPSL